MSDPENPVEPPPESPAPRARVLSQKERRAQALQAALRENLRRRKTAQSEANPASEEDHEKAREKGDKTP